MGVENNLAFLENYQGHVAANRGTDNRFAKAIEMVIGLIKQGSDTRSAFDNVDRIVEEENIINSQS